MPRQKILGEGLGAFQLGGRLRWDRNYASRRPEAINHAGHQRRFGPHDGQIDSLFQGKAQQRVNIVGSDGDIFTACSSAVPALPGAT